MAGDRKMWEQWKDWRLTEPINEGSKAVKAYKEMSSAVTTAIYGIKNFRKIVNDGPYDKKIDRLAGELYKFEIDLEKKLRLIVPQMKKLSTDKRLESVIEEHTVVFSKDEMEQLHRDGKLIKADSEGKDHTYIYSED